MRTIGLILAAWLARVYASRAEGGRGHRPARSHASSSRLRRKELACPGRPWLDRLQLYGDGVADARAGSADGRSVQLCQLREPGAGRAAALSGRRREFRTGSRVPFAPPGRGLRPWLVGRQWLAHPDPALDLWLRWAAGQPGRPRLRPPSRAAAVTTMPASRSSLPT